MSWSVQLIGKPEAVAAELDKVSESLSGQSRVEFDAAKPHLQGLVRQNFAKENTQFVAPLVRLNASGSGTAYGDEQTQRTCMVTVEPLYGKVLL